MPRGIKGSKKVKEVKTKKSTPVEIEELDDEVIDEEETLPEAPEAEAVADATEKKLPEKKFIERKAIKSITEQHDGYIIVVDVLGSSYKLTLAQYLAL